MSHSVNENLKILVIGDIMLDHYIYGNCNRISPEAPVPIVEVKSESYSLGGAGNVLKNLYALGCPADIICLVGDDDGAETVKNELSAYDITSQGVLTDNARCTTIKTRVLVNNHQMIRLDSEITNPISNKIENEIFEIIRNEVKDYKILLLSDYNKGLFTEKLLNRIFDLCHQLSIKTLVDPKGTDFSKYKGANIIKPNKKEAIAASGVQITDRESLLKACTQIQKITNCDQVIITMSEEGIALYSDGDVKIIPTKAIDVVDVTGAGDTVLASLGMSLATGNNLHDACMFANHAAAIVVSKVGSSTATLQEIKEKFPD